MEKGRDGIAVFYRRMGLLALIGLLHLMLLWSGDILLLYALAGCCCRCSGMCRTESCWRLPPRLFSAPFSWMP